MATTKYRQDMPPPGGYQPVPYKRIPARQYFSGWALFGGYLGISVGAFYIYYLNVKAVHKRELEMRSASFAIYPMLLAERDRAYLKQLNKNREEERDLMKNIEGWKVGTYYGKPIFQTFDKDTLHSMNYHEYYVHAPYKDFAKRASLLLWS